MAINFLDSINIKGLDGGVALDIQGSQGQLFSVTDDLSGDIFAVSDISGVPILNVNSNGTSYFDGKLGIGTTTPLGLLHVSSGTSGNAVVIIESDTDNNNENDNPQLQFKQDGGNTIAKAGITGDAGQIFGNSLGNAAYLGNDENASVQFYTNATAALTIREDGDIGIGTTSPGEKLEVAGNVILDASNARLKLKGGVTGTNSGIDWTFNSASTQYARVDLDYDTRTSVGLLIDSGYPITLDFSAGRFAIQNNGSERMRVNANGNVGIGETSPILGKLQVGGIIHVNRSASNGTSANPIFENILQSGLNLTNLSSVQLGNSFGSDNGTFLRFQVNSTAAASTPLNILTLKATGGVTLGTYTGSAQTGTPTFLLGTDASGNIVKTNTIPGSGAGPYLPLAGGTMTGTGEIRTPDNFKLKVGTAGDMEIYHNATNTLIDNQTGNLLIQTTSGSVQINKGTAENMAEFITDGAVKLYYDSAKKFETTNTGVTVTGQAVISNGIDVNGGNVDLLDNVRLRVGTASDLQIYHDGSNSYIDDAGTGDLYIRANNLRLANADGSGQTINANNGGNVELFHNNSKKFETTNTGVDVTGIAQVSEGVKVTGFTTPTGIGAEMIYTSGSSIFQSYDRTNSAYLPVLLDGSTAKIQIAGVPKLTINSSGNATFAGTINSGAITSTGTVTATTFLGDLNGTINTATTAATQANATNNTTVATTAFVQNLIGTIPAGLVFQGTWNAATNTPTLASGSGTTGHFYIVSTSGSTNLDGVTDWVTGDWAVFIEQGGTDAWEKIDNSSVLDGAGTGQKIAKWDGSGTSNTLADSIITEGSSNIIIGGALGVGTSSAPARELEVTGDGNVYVRLTAKLDTDSTAIE